MAKKKKKKKTSTSSGGKEYDLKNYPLPGFHFQVDFLFEGKSKNEFGGPQESSFMEVSGIKASMDIEDYNELGFIGQSHGMINGRKFDNLVLKRGLTYSSKLIKWFETCLYRKETTHIPVLVSVLNTEGKANRGKPLLSWLFFQAYPVSIEFSGLNAMNSEYIIETLELRHSYFIQLDTKGAKDLSNVDSLFGMRKTKELK